jgi:CheY-like chemotaxis protein
MGEKVLVVDDDPPSGKTMMWAMEAMGHEVHLVHDGRSALHEILDFVPGVVLCDIKMPGMLGYEVCEKMKADARLKDTLFIAQTGLDSPLSRRKSLESGFAYYLVKPVDVNALLELVYLERAKMRAGHL